MKDVSPRSAPPTLLPTTVVGSYSVPEWLGRLKNDYYQGRISGRHLAEIHNAAIKAAVKDQERAGVDIVSDGELRRDNDTDYLLARIPGIHIPQPAKADYYDYYDAYATGALPETGRASIGLAGDFAFTREQTDQPVKFAFTGPFSLSRRVRNDGAYSGFADLVRALARLLNAEARELARAGATLLQIDEPFLAGCPEDVELAIEAVNIVTHGVEVSWALHVCYGNRHLRPLWEGRYDFLFPAVLDARVDQLVLEFARKGPDDLRLFRQYPWDRAVGVGVVDVKTEEVETPDIVASRIRRALEHVPAERMIVNPDCGLRNLPTGVAHAKLRAMAEGAATVRGELSGQSARPGSGRASGARQRTGGRSRKGAATANGDSPGSSADDSTGASIDSAARSTSAGSDTTSPASAGVSAAL